MYIIILKLSMCCENNNTSIYYEWIKNYKLLFAKKLIR